MQGRRPKQEDRHVLTENIASLVEGKDKAAIEALNLQPGRPACRRNISSGPPITPIHTYLSLSLNHLPLFVRLSLFGCLGDLLLPLPL